MATRIKIKFNYEMKNATVIPANITVTSNTPETITGSIAEFSVWDGTTHEFIWTCTDNGKGIDPTEVELDSALSYAMVFSDDVLDILNLESDIANKTFGS